MASLRQRTYAALFPVMGPGSRLNTINRVLVIVIMGSIAFAALATEPRLTHAYPKLFFTVELGFSAVFLIEYCARLWAVASAPDAPTESSTESSTESRVDSSAINGETGTAGKMGTAGKSGAAGEVHGDAEDRSYAVRGGWSKRLHYLISPLGLIDLAVVLASFAALFHPAIPLLRVLRLIRLFHLIRYGKFVAALRQLGSAIAERRYDLLVTLTIGLILLMSSATLLYWVEGDVQPDKFGSVPRAMWWSIITLTTVGYGDAAPITSLGRLIASVVAVGGIALVAMPTGIIAAAFSDAMQRHKDAEESTGSEKI